jgi:selenocysteine-specific elongation factor
MGHQQPLPLGGHERFIKNMLVGVGGIDIALLVVAADESIMPQTREHLAILDLLNVRTGAVALTKRDLVDADWLELVQAEVEETLEGTSLQGAPMLPVSSTSGDGLDELRATLDRLLLQAPAKPNTGWPRCASGWGRPGRRCRRSARGARARRPVARRRRGAGPG